MRFLETLRALGFRGHGRKPNTEYQRNLQLEHMQDRRLLTVIDLATLPSSQGSIVYGAEAGDNAYQISDAGDFNGDGIDDVIVATVGGGSIVEAYVVFGDTALGQTVDLTNLGTGGVTILGGDPSEQYVFWLDGAGDVNGDGYDDVTFSVGSGIVTNEIRVYIIYGGGTLPSLIDMDNLGSAGVKLTGTWSYPASLYVSDAGDVNGDGFDDVII